ncbi:AAA family ATPase [Kitasatospora sp. NPDC052896]|uniref:AAA family ATPase n=1 Tax=Kitasatospora sp. NPDC052896 TaxID=3364061 RepID=UPI0037CB2744
MEITAEHGAEVTVHTGPLPTPVRRQPISQLPRSSSTSDPLIGREGEIERLREAVETRQLVHIWGPSGIGKSALLRHLALTLPHGPEGVAYIEARGRTREDLSQAIFDVSFDAPNYKPSPEVIKEHLKTLRLRIYLDDAGLPENELRRLFDLAPTSTFVFTSEQESAIRGAQSIRLNGLTVPAAAKLIGTLLGRKLRPGEQLIMAAWWDAVDGNPLRLRRLAPPDANRLPSIDELPELLPALVRALDPEENGVLRLLASLSDAELSGMLLTNLLGQPEVVNLADDLVRRGLLLASEIGYSCPIDVAEHVLTQHASEEYPTDRLCEQLTAWIVADDTTPDDVAAHFRVLDIAVLHAEATGHAALGVALARAASPKLARSLQFDAWGTLLGAGWVAATTAQDREGQKFFLHTEGMRNKALGKTALATILLTEALVLGKEISALQAGSATQPIASAAASQPVGTAPSNPASTTSHTAPPNPASTASHTAPPNPASTTSHTAASNHMTAMAHTTITGHVSVSASVTGSGAGAGSVGNATQAGHETQAAQVTHTTVANSMKHAATQTATNSTMRATASSVPHMAAAGGHAVAVGATTVAAKGATGLILACVIGFAAVAGVGAVVYASDQSNTSQNGASPAVSPTSPSSDPTSLPTWFRTSVYADAVCDSAITEEDPLDQDSSNISDALSTYNEGMDEYNSGLTSTQPSATPLNTAVQTMISDLKSTDSTVQDEASQAQNSTVISALNSVSSALEQLGSAFQTYLDDQQGSPLDISSEDDQLTKAEDAVYNACFTF